MERQLLKIMEDYGMGRDIDGVAACRPDQEMLKDWMGDLRGALLPGYFGDQDRRELLERTARRTDGLLQAVLCREDGAREAGAAFFDAIPAVRSLLQTDLQAAYDGDPAATGAQEVLLAYPGVYAVSVYRLAHVLYELKVPLLPRMMTEYAHSLTGIDIHPGAQIGPYFFIDHGTGVVIGQTCIIGAHVKLYQGVTLGALTTRGGQQLRGRKRHPTIGDYVTIYAGASILGGDTVVGNNCIIGSNVFLTASVAPDTTVRSGEQELRFKTRG